MSDKVLPHTRMQPFGDFGEYDPRIDEEIILHISSLYGTHDSNDQTRTLSTQYTQANPLFNPNATAAYMTPSISQTASAMTQSRSTGTVPPQYTFNNPNQSSTSSLLDYTSGLSHMAATYANDHAREERAVVEDSEESRKDSHSPITILSRSGRRRKSENVEEGSARAIYLAKNRQAASKCRNKQKRQQEDLVEQARDLETRNKMLRAEVDLLRDGVREFKDAVTQHAHCGDSRLQMYMQRVSDRLAAGGSGAFSQAQPFKQSPTSQDAFSSASTFPDTQQTSRSETTDSMETES